MDSEESDLEAVDAVHAFHRHLVAANERMAELDAACHAQELTVMLLARVNLAWDLVDAYGEFLASTSRTQECALALLAAHARLRTILGGKVGCRRAGESAEELVRQVRRLAERLMERGEVLRVEAVTRAESQRCSGSGKPPPRRASRAVRRSR